MDQAFGSVTTFSCPSTDADSISFTSLSDSILSVPDPIIEGELFDFPLPAPLAPFGCQSVSVITEFTREATSFFFSGQFLPQNGDFCDILMSFSFNVPPLDALLSACGPDDLEFGTTGTTITKDDSFGLAASFSDVDPCEFNLDIDLKFACPLFSASVGTVSHSVAYEATASLGVVDKSEAETCEFDFDLDLNLPCAVPRVGAMITIDSDISAPLVFLSISDVPGSEDTEFNIVGASAFAMPPDIKNTIPVNPDTLVGSETFPPNYFHGCYVEMLSGLNAGQIKAIQAFTQYPGAGAGIITYHDFPVAVGSGDVFKITCGGQTVLSVPDAVPPGPCDKLWILDIRLPPFNADQLDVKKPYLGKVIGRSRDTGTTAVTLTMRKLLSLDPGDYEGSGDKVVFGGFDSPMVLGDTALIHTAEALEHGGTPLVVSWMPSTHQGHLPYPDAACIAQVLAACLATPPSNMCEVAVP